MRVCVKRDCAANVAQESVASAGIPNLAGPQAVTIIDNIEQYGKTVSEDCLTLNVWTKPQTGEAKKAVMVWIYGGGERNLFLSLSLCFRARCLDAL